MISFISMMDEYDVHYYRFNNFGSAIPVRYCSAEIFVCSMYSRKEMMRIDIERMCGAIYDVKNKNYNAIT